MSAISNAIAFWRPALKQDAASSFHYHLSYDEMSMFIRSIIVTAGAFFVALNRSRNLSIILPPVMLLIGKVCFSFEYRRATTALNQLAIDMFMKNDPVPQRVIDYIGQNELAAFHLCAQPQVDLNKISDQLSQNLLTSAFNNIRLASYSLRDTSQTALDICKLLIEKGACVTNEFFLKTIRSEEHTSELQS